MSKKRVLVIGSSNLDFVMNMYKLPEAGESIVDNGGVAYIPGGKGANAAIALSRLGAESVLCAKLGADIHGQRLYNYYKDMGLNTSFIKVDHDNPTGLAVVMKEGDGTTRSVVFPGANAELTTEMIMEAFECQPDAVYLGFEIPFSAALSAAKIASARNIPIFIDPAPANKEFGLENLPEIEVFSPNESETYEYTGIAPTTMENSVRACLALTKRVKCKDIVLKLGQRGAFLYDGKRYSTFPAVRVDKTVDTTAAGDAFTAALTLEYLRCGDIKEAIKYANVAGAITVTRPGASVSVPTEEEVRSFIAASLEK